MAEQAIEMDPLHQSYHLEGYTTSSTVSRIFHPNFTAAKTMFKLKVQGPLRSLLGGL